MRKKIILDVDGVLLNFIERFTEVVLDTVKRELTINDVEYNLTKRFGISEQEEQLVWQRFADSGSWEKLEPLAGVIESVKKINALDYDVYIVTAIEGLFVEQRRANLEKIGLNPIEIYCAGYNKSKQDYFELINPDIIVDDRLENLHVAPECFHLVWIKDQVEQHNLKEDGRVDVSVSSLKEWVDNHLPEVDKELESYYNKNKPLQRKLRFI
jgi:hypothetical protein